MATFDVYGEVRLMMRYRVEEVDDTYDAEQRVEDWIDKGIKGAVVERETLSVVAERASDTEVDDESEEKTLVDPFEEDED